MWKRHVYFSLKGSRERVGDSRMEKEVWKASYGIQGNGVSISSMPAYLLQLLLPSHSLTFFSFYRKIVAEFEGTITQMMGKFWICIWNYSGGCV